MNLPMIGLILFCVILEASREICFKKAADNETFWVAFAKPLTWLGIFFWAIELIAWTMVLQHMALSIAFPFASLAYIALVVAGAVVFREKITLRHGLGAGLITAGVACIGATGL